MEKLTIGLHDELWIAASRALPKIEKNLRVANGISCAKELHSLGMMNDEEFIKTLKMFLTDSGYTY